MKAMKFLCCLCMGMMMTALSGCSDDKDASNDDYFETEWRQCVPGCFVMEFLGYDTIYNNKALISALGCNVIALSRLEQQPIWRGSYNYPTMGWDEPSFFFNPSDLPNEDFRKNRLFICGIKEYRCIRMKGLYHDGKSIGKVEPYHSDLTLHNIHGTIQTGQYHSNIWTIVYEQNGQRNLLIPIYLDDALKEEGLQVVFSGELFEYTHRWYIDDPDIAEERFEEIHRIRLTDISAM